MWAESDENVFESRSVVHLPVGAIGDKKGLDITGASHEILFKAALDPLHFRPLIFGGVARI